MSDYEKIAAAITYIAEHVSKQPSLEDIAAHVHLSPFHFQRLFCRWTGTTPKKILEALTLEHSKKLLRETDSLLDLSNAVGLSSSSRLHDHFVNLEAVTPGEYKSQGANLNIEYGIHASPFGDIFIAITKRGICRAAFVDYETPQQLVEELQKHWPKAHILKNNEATQLIVAQLFNNDRTPTKPLSLHVAGTNFQMAVWKALLRIPQGDVASYSQIAATLSIPKASRAVGNAVAANPVAFLIPCHRVILASGLTGNFRWGGTRKQAMQIWERARSEESV